MNAITKALNENIVGEHGSSTSENCREIEAAIDRVMELIKRPEYEPYLRFVVFWNEFDALLAELQHKLKQRLAEQPIDSFEELHAILIGGKK